MLTIAEDTFFNVSPEGLFTNWPVRDVLPL